MTDTMERLATGAYAREVEEIKALDRIIQSAMEKNDD